MGDQPSAREAVGSLLSDPPERGLWTVVVVGESSESAASWAEGEFECRRVGKQVSIGGNIHDEAILACYPADTGLPSHVQIRCSGPVANLIGFNVALVVLLAESCTLMNVDVDSIRVISAR